mmetsp:Transcript_49933/g.57305  ORF Transcript_49933/g.57305 Transcript_49933/m.57305 type:complete len:84 (+) Transcript_49933:194-445(+)
MIRLQNFSKVAPSWERKGIRKRRKEEQTFWRVYRHSLREKLPDSPTSDKGTPKFCFAYLFLSTFTFPFLWILLLRCFEGVLCP